MSLTQAVQLCRNHLRTLARIAVTMQIAIEDLANKPRFRLVNDQALLHLVLADRDHLGRIPERRTGAISIPLTRILTHRPQRMLPVFLALVFVEDRKNLACHLPIGIITRLLRNRNQAYPALIQPTFVQGRLLFGIDNCFAARSIDIPVCLTSLTASARNSGEYNLFGSRSSFILQIVNYTIRRTPLFPAYRMPMLY